MRFSSNRGRSQANRCVRNPLLTRDILPITWPEDNFTLELDIPSSGWSYTVITTQENITENSSAIIEMTEMNPSPESDYTVFATQGRIGAVASRRSRWKIWTGRLVLEDYRTGM